jgi:hypothetical protein
MGNQKNSIFLLALTMLGTMALISCGKDKYTTKPQLTFKKSESQDVSRGGFIRFFLEITDAEGDLSDTLFLETTTTRCPQSNRKLSYLIPPFPTSTNTKAELEITFVNGVFLQGYVPFPGPACGRPDTTTFKFWVKDKAQNISDTVQTDKPIIIRN